MAKASSAPKPPTKSEIMNNIAEATEMTKKEVAAFFDALGAEIEKNIAKKSSAGMFTSLAFARLSSKTSLLCLVVRSVTRAPAKWFGRLQSQPADKLKSDL